MAHFRRCSDPLESELHYFVVNLGELVQRLQESFLRDRLGQTKQTEALVNWVRLLACAVNLGGSADLSCWVADK